MNKYLSIFSITILAVVMVSGCKMDYKDINQKNTKGMQITSYWQTATQQVLDHYANTAFKFNAWLSASEEERPAIEEKYFKNITISQVSEKNWTLVRDGKTICSINTNGVLLSEFASKTWVLQFYDGDLNYGLLHFGADTSTTVIINPHHSGFWAVLVQRKIPSPTDVMSINDPYADFHIQSLEEDTIPETLDSFNCIISGEGWYGVHTNQYVSIGNGHSREIINYIHFKMQDCLTEDIIHWKGKLNMRVYSDRLHSGEDNGYYPELNILDELDLRGKQQYATITINDVTETWEIPYYVPDDGPEFGFDILW